MSEKPHDIPEDAWELAYDEADGFADFYGCDNEIRFRLTEAMARMLLSERERAKQICIRRADYLKKVPGYHSEVAELTTAAAAIGSRD